MQQRIKNSLFREPGQGINNAARRTFGYLAVLVGGFLIIGGGVYLGSLFWMSLGLFNILQGTAELLPRDRTTLAGWLRVAGLLQALLLLSVLTVATTVYNL